MRHPSNLVATAAQRCKKFFGTMPPALTIVLGSGFKGLAKKIEDARSIAYTSLPGFPRPTVAGHEGTLIRGKLFSSEVLVLNGRSHFYEGCTMEEVTFSIRVLARWGVRDILLTNAAGGLTANLNGGTS